MARGGGEGRGSSDGGGGIGAGEELRLEGNARFKKCDWTGAIESYDRALAALVGPEGGGSSISSSISSGSSSSSSSSSSSKKPQALRGEEKDAVLKCLTNRAIAYFKLEEYARSAADCSAALALEPTHGKARFRRACARKKSGEWEGARADLEACIAQNCSPRDCQKLLQEMAAARAASMMVQVGPPSNVVRVGFSSSSSNGARASSSSAKGGTPPFHPALQHAGATAPLPTAPTANPPAASPPSSSAPSKNPDPIRWRPGRRRQAWDVRRLLRQLQQAGPEPGDAFALLPAEWWRAWRAHVGWEDGGTDDEEAEEDEAGAGGHKSRMLGRHDSVGEHEQAADADDPALPPPPPPIDTSVLLLQDPQARRSNKALRPGLQQGADWEAVPLEVWQALSSWYGCSEGQEAVQRSVAAVGPQGQVELQLYAGPEDEQGSEEGATDDDDDDEGTTCSAASSVASVTPTPFAARPCSACQARTTQKCSRCRKAFYCARGCQAAHWRYHKAQCVDDGRPLLDLARRGRVGLVNLGNTCYMNSALQCLSHVAPLTRHFLTGAFRADLNLDSALGTGGRVVAEYDALLKEMWLGTQGQCNPLALKRAVVRFAPQFMGTAQHDAHELLQFLVDALHEDLNRVREKPYIETPDYDLKRPDAEQADEAWARSLQREDSVVVDHLWGQLKSKLVCPDCSRVSIVFDPFWTLTLELPDTNLRALRVLVFPRPDRPQATAAAAAAMDVSSDGQGGAPQPQPPRLVTVQVSRRGCVWDVKQALQAACGVRREHLYLALVSDRKVDDFLADNLPLTKIPPSVDALAGPAGNTRGQQGRRGLDVEGPDDWHLLAYEVPPLHAQEEFGGGGGDPQQQQQQQQEQEEEDEGEEAASQASEARDGAFLVLHHRRHRPPGARGPAPGMAMSEVAGGGEDPSYEMLGFPILLNFDPRWPLRRLREQLWRHVRRLVMVSAEEGELDGFEEALTGALPVLQTDDMARNLVYAAPAEEEVVEEGDGDSAPMDASSSGGGSGSRGSVQGQEEDEEGSMAVVEEEGSQEEAEDEEKVIAAYLPFSSPIADETPVASLLHPGKEANAYWMALDWEGALAGRFWGMRTPGLNEDGRLAFGMAAAGDASAAAAAAAEEQHAAAAAAGVIGGGERDGVLTLDHCLRKYASPERLDRDNPWYCGRCKQHKQAVKTLHLWRLPRVLIICLKRFDARDRKLDALVDFPLEGLDLSAHCHGPIGNGDAPIYDLFAVSNHFGSRGWGHYTACARSWDVATGRLDPQWYRFDDSVCEPVPVSRVKTKEAYTLFYRRREGAKAPTPRASL